MHTMGVCDPPGLPISYLLSESRSLRHTRICAHNYRLGDICCIESVEQLEGAQAKGDMKQCSCLWVCKCVPVFTRLCEDAFVCLLVFPGRAAAEHTAWQQQQQLFREVIFHSFQGLLSESLSYIMFFHTSTAFSHTDIYLIYCSNVCCIFFLSFFSSVPNCLSSSVSLVELSY